MQCPPTYPDGCKIVFCGEAPSEDEVRLGEGFSGKEGRVLDKAMAVAGISRKEVGLTNVVKRIPDGGADSEQFEKTFYVRERVGRRILTRLSDELIGWIGVLASEIERVRPKVVVACGQHALSALTGLSGITKWQGSVIESTLVPGVKVVPVMHPSWIMRKAQWQALYTLGRILSSKVVPESEFPEIRRQGWHEQTAPTIGEVCEYARSVSGPWTLDIELRGNALSCVGLAFGPLGRERSICVPIQTTTGPYFSVEEEYTWWRCLQELCERNTQGPIGHNIVCDMGWLSRYGIRPCNAEDTMLLFHRLYAELPKKLAFLNMLYTDIPYYKDDGKTWGQREPDEKLWHYNLKDVVSTLRVWHGLHHDQEVMVGKSSKALYETLAKPLVPIAIEMQNEGMRGDPAALLLAKAVATVELCKIREYLSKLTEGVLVVREGNSKITDRQVMDYLYRTLGLPKKKKFSTGSETADEDAIVELMVSELSKKTSPHLEVLRCILAERKFFKLLTSYINIDWGLKSIVTEWAV